MTKIGSNSWKEQSSATLAELPIQVGVFSAGNPWIPRLGTMTWTFVGLGAVIRLVRFLLRFPLWPDESFLAANFINGGFRDLLGPLAYHQISPPLFLWAELAVVKLLGFTEYTLRLFPLLCGLAAVFLFLRFARILLKGEALLLAVAVFAVAYYPIRHGAEVKPYAADLFVSMVILLLAVEWRRNPGRPGLLWGLAAAAPFAVGVSLPAVFVAGGVSLGLAGSVWREKRWRTILPYLLFNLILVAAFLAVYAFSAGPQYETETWLHRSYWLETFPPLGHPARLLLWLLDTHTGRMFAYPNGGTGGGSVLNFICFLAGAAVFWRRKRRAVLLILLSPFLLTFIAAALHRYPYGYSVRFNLYLAPIICLLIGTGAARLLALIGKERVRSTVFLSLIGLLFLAGSLIIASDIARPYKNIEDVNSRDFARVFWDEQSKDAVLICVRTDSGFDLSPGLWEFGHSARYLCHQRIYSPVHRTGARRRPAELSSADHLLRCVVFSIPEPYIPVSRPDEEARARWRRGLEAGYEQTGYQKFVINEGVKGQHETYEVFDFRPRSDTSNRLD